LWPDADRVLLGRATAALQQPLPAARALVDHSHCIDRHDKSPRTGADPGSNTEAPYAGAALRSFITSSEEVLGVAAVDNPGEARTQRAPVHQEFIVRLPSGHLEFVFGKPGLVMIVMYQETLMT